MASIPPIASRFEIEGKAFGAGESVMVIAEMAWSHDGKRDMALAIAAAAASAGADVLNIHLTSLPDYMTRAYGSGAGRVSAGNESESVYRYLEEISLGDDDWAEVARFAHNEGLLLSCMCNDIPSLALADRLSADLLTIAPAGLAERSYISAAAERGLPLMLGVGGATLGEIESALEIAREGGAGSLLLQYGVQSYPTDPSILNLRYLDTLSRAFGLPVAYHDHTEAGTALALQVPLASLALGVAGVEKHVTHDRSLRGEDFESALDPAELAEFVAAVRTVEGALGKPSWRPLGEAELNYREVVRKRAVARADVGSGTPLDEATVTFKRADAGLYPDEFELLAGRPARRDLAADEPIEAGDVG